MTDAATHVLVPYSAFLACRERRRRIVAALTACATEVSQAPEAQAMAMPVPVPKEHGPADSGCDAGHTNER